MKKIVLDTRGFICINTTEYDGCLDNTAMVQSANGLLECTKLGWDLEKTYPCKESYSKIHIGEMNVGDLIMSEDYKGAYLMRIA